MLEVEDAVERVCPRKDDDRTRAQGGQDDHRGTEVFIARSNDPLPVGAAVIVLSTLGPRTVVVFPWADPLDSILDL